MKRALRAALSLRLALPLAAALAAAAPAPAEAQDLVEARPRQGYYIAAGLKQGLTFNDFGDTDDLGLMQGGGFSFRLGQMASEWIGFGLGLVNVAGVNDQWVAGAGGLMLETQLVPLPGQLPVALSGGIGVGGLALTRRNEEDVRRDDPEGTAGTLYTLGLSVDWFPFHDPGDGSGGWAATFLGELFLLPGDDALSTGFMMGLEITWWSGLADNRLVDPELDDAEPAVEAPAAD